MSSSPGDRRYAIDSPENKDGAQLYQGNDNFLPLDFSTPQHRNSGPGSNNRNYYSAQPKYMLPRQRGFQNRNRNQYQQHQDNRGDGGGNSPAADDEERPAERRKFQNRDRRGQNFHQRHHNRPHHNEQYQQRGNRFGFGHSLNKKSSEDYNINDYFHPSMLEDPWLQLVQQSERDKTLEDDSSDAGGGGGGGSDGGED
uniref:Uncharacterized protein n=1 Tax=Ochlerotatus triseriatus TaxID=7162 RepID=C6ZQP7_OCHTR